MKKQADLFKPITPDFHASIEDALAEAQAPKKKRKMPLLIPGVMLAAILFLGLTPVMFPNVLGTPDEPTLVPETIGKYAFDLNVVQPGQTETAAPATAGPEFVKLIVDPIEGYMDHEDYYAATIPDFVRDPRCEGVKWAPVDNHSASGYSFSLSRPKEGEQLFNNVGSYKTLTIAGREAIIIEPAGSYPLRRVMMMYKKVNILVICYINMKIPMADMITALEGVNVIEGTLENHTPYSVGYKSASSNAGAPVSAVIAEDLIFPEIGEEFTRHENITAKMESIEILSNVKKLDSECFQYYGYNRETETWLQYRDYVDAEGNLLPRISEVWEPGDRVNTVDTLVESKPYEQKYILFQVTFTNHGKQDYHYTTGFSLNFYDKDENGNLVKSLALLNDRNATTDEFMYLSRNAEGKVSDRPLNGLELTAGETKTVTIGYRCDERLLDQAYLTCKIGYDDALELTALKVQKDG